MKLGLDLIPDLAIDDAVYDLEPLLEWASRDEKAGLEGPADAD